jgi:hypothetical protein
MDYSSFGILFDKACESAILESFKQEKTAKYIYREEETN